MSEDELNRQRMQGDDKCFSKKKPKKTGEGPEMRDLIPAHTLQELIALRKKVTELENEEVELKKDYADLHKRFIEVEKGEASLKDRLEMAETLHAALKKERGELKEELSKVEKGAQSALGLAREIVDWFEFEVSGEANYRERLDAIEKSLKECTDERKATRRIAETPPHVSGSVLQDEQREGEERRSSKE